MKKVTVKNIATIKNLQAVAIKKEQLNSVKGGHLNEEIVELQQLAINNRKKRMDREYPFRPFFI